MLSYGPLPHDAEKVDFSTVIFYDLQPFGPRSEPALALGGLVARFSLQSWLWGAARSLQSLAVGGM